MLCTLRKFDRDEITDLGNPAGNTPRMKRLRNLVCGGPWGNDNEIDLIYWLPDEKVSGGGYWVAWKDPDPLPPAGVVVGS
jgi:hypothetical protein